MVLFGAMAAASAVILLVVDSRRAQMLPAVLVMFGAALVLTNLGQKRAEHLGVRSSADLPPIPRVPRFLVAGVGLAVFTAFVLTSVFPGGWFLVLLTAQFAADDLLRRHAFRSVLRGEPYTGGSSTASRRAVRFQRVATFLFLAGFYGSFTGLAQHRSLAGSIFSGVLFGALMTYFFERIRRKDLARRESRETSPDRTAEKPGGH